MTPDSVPALADVRVLDADTDAVLQALATPEVVGYAQVDFFPASLSWGAVPAPFCRKAGGEQDISSYQCGGHGHAE
jgi:hypothetical protein